MNYQTGEDGTTIKVIASVPDLSENELESLSLKEIAQLMGAEEGFGGRCDF